MVFLNFLTEKILKYHKKKLNDAIKKLKLHQKMRKHLETKSKSSDDSSNNIQKEIINQNQIISIWEKNIITIKEEIEKLQK